MQSAVCVDCNRSIFNRRIAQKAPSFQISKRPIIIYSPKRYMRIFLLGILTRWFIQRLFTTTFSSGDIIRHLLKLSFSS